MTDHKQPETQAQAGDPEVVAWAHWEQVGFDEEPMRLVVKTGPLNEHDKRTAKWFPLITLQSHREAMDKLLNGPLGKKEYEEMSYELQAERDAETKRAIELEKAIAKKDAALKACVEALGVARANPGDCCPWLDRIDAAITQAESALK